MLTNPANGRHACDGTTNAPPNNVLGGAADIQAGAKCLFLAPAERADVIVDFAGQAGKTFTMKNFAVIPFPSGGPVGFGAPDATSDGLVMQFRVNLPLQGRDTSFNPAGAHPPLRATPIVNIKPANGRGDKLRQLILVEEEGNSLAVDAPGAPDGDGEPVESLINNTKWNGNREGSTIPVPGSTSNGRGLLATETPREGSTEVWEIANLTGDAHPIHIHLIQFQVISRQPFDVTTYLTDWIAIVPGRNLQRVHLRARRLHPRLRPSAATTRRRTPRELWVAISTSTQPSICYRERAPKAAARRARPRRATPAGRTRSRCSPAKSLASRCAGRRRPSRRGRHDRGRICSRSIRPTARATSSTATSSITKTTSSCDRC